MYRYYNLYIIGIKELEDTTEQDVPKTDHTCLIYNMGNHSWSPCYVTGLLTSLILFLRIRVVSSWSSPPCTAGRRSLCSGGMVTIANAASAAPSSVHTPSNDSRSHARRTDVVLPGKLAASGSLGERAGGAGAAAGLLGTSTAAGLGDDDEDRTWLSGRPICGRGNTRAESSSMRARNLARSSST